MAFRQLKRQVLAALRTPSLTAGLSLIIAWPPRQVINPLLSLLYDDDEPIRWRAVTAIGEVVGRLAEHNMESARVIMRRLMWNLNDESGGIGWGSPEAMGEIMARSEPLACEYAAILVSYLNPEGNYLEHPGLQAGVLWAIGRLGRIRPRLVQDAIAFLPPLFASDSAQLRGMAVWAYAALAAEIRIPLIEPLLHDTSPMTLYSNDHSTRLTVAQIAQAVLADSLS